MKKKFVRFIQRFNGHISQDYSQIARNENERTLVKYLARMDLSYGINTERREERIVVSLTTYGQRVFTVENTIQSLLSQTMKADRIVLWLAYDMKEDRLPITLERMKQRGLEILYCDDLKSYKKLVPIMESEPESIIITVDDDMIYPTNMIESMYYTHLDCPDCVVFNYGNKMEMNNGKVMPYSYWKTNTVGKEPSHAYLGIGVGGILYPPNALNVDVTKKEIFTEIAPSTDDLWFKIMALLNGTRYVRNHYIPSIRSEKEFLRYFITVEDEQQEKLGTANVVHGQNDIQLQNICDRYHIDVQCFSD